MNLVSMSKKRGSVHKGSYFIFLYIYFCIINIPNNIIHIHLYKYKKNIVYLTKLYNILTSLVDKYLNSPDFKPSNVNPANDSLFNLITS